MQNKHHPETEKTNDHREEKCNISNDRGVLSKHQQPMSNEKEIAAPSNGIESGRNGIKRGGGVFNDSSKDENTYCKNAYDSKHPFQN